MKREYYELPPAGWVKKALWKCAGGDRYLLEHATYSDQIKYMCLGGIVFATGAMAGLAGGYAFYTIFEERGSAIDNPVDVKAAVMAVVFGIIWGLIIYNIDRFIVTSTGKGDGTEAITIAELKTALPRIIMGAIIAMTISKPVEIRMFKTEIDIKLREKQLEQQAEYQAKVEQTYADREKLLLSDFKKLEDQRKILLNKIKEYDDQYREEMAAGQGGRGKGEGPVALALKSERQKAEADLNSFDSYHSDELKELNNRKKQLREAKENERGNNEAIANGLDGLLERIKIAHEVAGFWISLFITLLFMAIELTPIFFKLMLTKTTYDYLAENRDELIKAENGIEVQYDHYTSKGGTELHLVVNHQAKKLIFEKKKVAQIQEELTNYAIERYKEREMRKIDENLDTYIRVADEKQV
ncbi:MULTISPECIES: DUF4407 domain-containing protein [unclassified Flavobacterium]|uniref:DUF4407 domain-containing protein n=1 Tax=unclassified Flavobacterium TaxID=196869 RepID=UPI001F137930|nr:MULTISPECIES: DUF4407 domain-containing protein [unclassified Flavobacterium]UMY64361.1 DUF4407 domain-containing protein [Flavobacterium sp. HJ-32-4]